MYDSTGILRKKISFNKLKLPNFLTVSKRPQGIFDESVGIKALRHITLDAGPLVHKNITGWILDRKYIGLG